MTNPADHPWSYLTQATTGIDPAGLTVDRFRLADDISRGPVEETGAYPEVANADARVEQRAEAVNDRKARQDAERAETATRAEADLDERMAAFDAERREREAAEAKLAVQDHDYHAFGVRVCFYFDRHEGTGGDRPATDWRLRDWDSEDQEGTALPESAVPEIIKAISPSLDHFGAIGFLRADGLEGALLGGLESPTSQPTFYVVCAAADASEVASLGEREPVSVAINALPGMSLTISYYVRPINATLLVEALRHRTEQVGPWGGSAGVIELPAANETRKDFLGRAAIPSEKLMRLAMRWERSGRDLTMFGLIGSATERVAGGQPIEWVVPGLILRGYVTVLVGNKMAGKSTLLGEIMAVIDSASQAPRYLLGTLVDARGMCGIVTGEDGDNFIDRRAEFYEFEHGESGSLVIDTSSYPWPVALQLLHGAPGILLVGVDPLRAMLVGKEESSDAINTLMLDLTALARAQNCAVILVHHFSKNPPRTFSGMLEAVRGAGTITDRARMVIGMIDRGAETTEIAIIKHNVPPGEPLWGEVNVGRLFKRDAKTLTLIPVENIHRSDGVGSNVSAIQDAIVEAVRYHNKVGKVVRRTGKSGLFESRAPQLNNVSRNTILQHLDQLIASGAVVNDHTGLLLNSDGNGQ